MGSLSLGQPLVPGAAAPSLDAMWMLSDMEEHSGGLLVADLTKGVISIPVNFLKESAVTGVKRIAPEVMSHLGASPKLTHQQVNQPRAISVFPWADVGGVALMVREGGGSRIQMFFNNFEL